MAETATTASAPTWGRLCISGGVNWPALGRQAKKAALENLDRPDLHEPHLYRSVANVAFTKVFTSHSGCHAVLVDVDGMPWFLGRNEHGQLGSGNTNDIDDPAALSSSLYTKAPVALRSAKIVHVACGRSHTLLVTDAGQLYVSGSNFLGMCGDPSTQGKDILSWKLIAGAWGEDKVVKAAAGVLFSIVLTASGRIYAFGTGEKGVLGNGKTGEHIAGGKTLYFEQVHPTIIRALEGKKIVDIATGQQHCLARDEAGYVYSWGFGGLGRLGQGVQADVLAPKVIAQFAHDRDILRARSIAAGPTCSLVVDGNGMQYLFGKFKISGDGSSGQPWMTPRAIHEIQAYKIKLNAAGGVTLFFAADERPGERIMIGFGQNAVSGELAMGVGAPKSATKCQRLETLDSLDVIDIAAGQNTTFFLVRPPAAEGVVGTEGSITNEDKFGDLPRFPAALDVPENCVVCNQDKGEADAPLECDKCEKPYHLGCVGLDALPPGEWFCAECLKPAAVSTSKRKVAVDDDADEEPVAKKKGPTKKRKSG